MKENTSRPSQPKVERPPGPATTRAVPAEPRGNVQNEKAPILNENDDFEEFEEEELVREPRQDPFKAIFATLDANSRRG